MDEQLPIKKEDVVKEEKFTWQKIMLWVGGFIILSTVVMLGVVYYFYSESTNPVKSEKRAKEIISFQLPPDYKVSAFFALSYKLAVINYKNGQQQIFIIEKNNDFNLSDKEVIQRIKDKKPLTQREAKRPSRSNLEVLSQGDFHLKNNKTAPYIYGRYSHQRKDKVYNYECTITVLLKDNNKKVVTITGVSEKGSYDKTVTENFLKTVE